ncbi:MAG: hypothetical protein A6F70_03920 [Cycloclasticus sp. symbiont of Bathymodiolus heckerae]|nr:MAG: hypothetical protein A6F70_03920 [Cycloclasticus sp. symbiont of Bathymodiolus heckerae]
MIGIFGAWGFCRSKGDEKGMNTSVVATFFLVSIGFIISSFMYDPIYGAMALGEIIIGFLIGYDYS